MKKMMFAVLLAALCLPLSAQDYSATLQSVTVESSYKYISPVLLSATEFNLQVLKDSAVNDDDYSAALTYLQKRLLSEGDAIKEALSTLKNERKLYDAQQSLYKERKGQAEAMKKQMESNVKTYQGYLKNIDKQYDLIKKIDNNTCEAIKGHSRMLDALRGDFNDDIERFKDLQKRMERENTEALNSTFTMLNDFLIELTDKETRLNSLQNQNKTNQEIVKNAIKVASPKKK